MSDRVLTMRYRGFVAEVVVHNNWGSKYTISAKSADDMEHFTYEGYNLAYVIDDFIADIDYYSDRRDEWMASFD